MDSSRGCARPSPSCRASRSSERWHRVFAASGRLENVSPPIDVSLDVAGFAGHAQLALGDVVVPFELFDTERPVLDGRSLRNPRWTVSLRRSADDLEIPCAQAPALGPVMQGRTA